MLTSHQKEKVLQLLHIQQKSPFLNCCSYTSTPEILLKISEIRALRVIQQHLLNKASFTPIYIGFTPNFLWGRLARMGFKKLPLYSN